MRLGHPWWDERPCKKRPRELRCSGASPGGPREEAVPQPDPNLGHPPSRAVSREGHSRPESVILGSPLPKHPETPGCLYVNKRMDLLHTALP